MNRDIGLGPIRPEHARNGWRLEGDNRTGWQLTKRLDGGLVAKVAATTETTVAWSVYRGGHLLREASALYVRAAQAAAVTWAMVNG